MATLKNTVINDTGYLKVAVGSTSQRVAGEVSELRYNNEKNVFEGYAASGWHTLSPFNHTVTGVTPGTGLTYITGTGLQINPGISGVFTISGFNFTSDATVFLDSTQITSGVVYNSPKQITVTTGTSFAPTAGSYSNIVVKNGQSGQSASFSYPVTVVGGPQFSTATNIGTFTEGTISTSVAATSPGGTVTYASNAISGNGGSGYGIPSGLTISSSGAITGTLKVTGTTTYNLTIKATDNSSRTASKDFTLTVTDSGNPTITAPSAGSVGSFTYQTPVSGTGTASTTITTFTATDPASATVYYRLTSGTLPTGITLDSSSGILKGSFSIGNKQPASQVFNFGVTAVDTNNNASPENQYSLTLATPYLHRQILTTGYIVGGYKSSTPWKNANRLNMTMELTVDLGDRLTYAVNYHGGTCSQDKLYTFGCNANGAADSYGTLTQVFNMRTEVNTMGTATSQGNRGQAAVLSGNDGWQLAAYVLGGFSGTNSGNIEKYTYATDVQSLLSATATSGNYYSAIAGSDETSGILQGSTARPGLTAQTIRLYYATDTTGTYGATISSSDQQKFLASKLGNIYGGNAGTYGSQEQTGADTFRKTNWATAAQWTMSKGYGAICGEENYVTGQYRGWMIGTHDGAQNNNSTRFDFPTDTGSTANTGTSHKGTSGASSATTGWRD
jgi:hypothetical protein